MHLIGFGFQPIEVTLDPIPSLGPLMIGIRAIIRISLDHPSLLSGSQALKRFPSGDLSAPTKLKQVFLALHSLPCLPGSNGSFFQREAVVWDSQVIVDGDHSPKAAAFRTGTGGVVETEKGSRRF